MTVSGTGGNTSIVVNQGCETQTVNLSPEGQHYLVSAGSVCGNFSFLSWSIDVPWISSLGTHGSGSQLEILVDRNTGPERVGHLTTDIGQVAFIQAAGGPANCVTAIAPASQAFDEDGGTGTITVTAAPGCDWEAIAHGDRETLTVISGRSGTGNGFVTFKMGVNTFFFGLSANLLIGGTQLFQITQSACLVTVSPLNVHVPAAGGNFSVTVNTSRAFCEWLDYSDPQFITRPLESRTGPGTVQFSVDPNQSGQGRSGNVYVTDKTVVVTQDP